MKIETETTKKNFTWKTEMSDEEANRIMQPLFKEISRLLRDKNFKKLPYQEKEVLITAAEERFFKSLGM